MKKANFIQYPVFLAAIIILSLATFSHIRVVLSPQPQELREGAVVLTTELLLEGKNIYTAQFMPVFVNVYGLLYNIVLLPFAWHFGLTFVIHRAISAFFILASCVLIYRIARLFNLPRTISFFTSLSIYVQLLLFGFDILSRPDSLGFFLFLLSMYLPLHGRFSGKSILGAIACSLLAFMAKPYFGLGLSYLPIYFFLFKSKKMGLIIALGAFLSFAAELAILNIIFPYYLYNVILIHMGIQSASWEHLLKQFLSFAYLNFGVMAGLIFYLLFPAKQLFRFSRKRLKQSFYLHVMDEPLVNLPISYLDLCLCLSFLFLLKLGFNPGSYLTYFTHLFTPLFIIKVFSLYVGTTKKRSVRLYFMILINLLIYLRLILIMPACCDQNEYAYWKAFLSDKKTVYAAPYLGFTVYREGKEIYDNGQTEYFDAGFRVAEALHVYQDAQSIYEKAQQSIEEKVKKKAFDVIVVPSDYFTFFDRDVLNKFYRLSEIRPFPMQKQLWQIEVWLPRD